MPVTLGSSGITFSNGTTQTTAATGTVTSVAATNGTGISISGSPITSSGTLTITNTGVTSVTAGSGISVSAATGGVTISASGGTPGLVRITNSSVSASASFNITGFSSTYRNYLITFDEFYDTYGALNQFFYVDLLISGTPDSGNRYNYSQFSKYESWIGQAGTNSILGGGTVGTEWLVGYNGAFGGSTFLPSTTNNGAMGMVMWLLAPYASTVTKVMHYEAFGNAFQFLGGGKKQNSTYTAQSYNGIRIRGSSGSSSMYGNWTLYGML